VGDVVVAYHPKRPGTVCKRVVGLPGDQVLKPNGSILVVPDGHIWLEGDNAMNSSDSRSYGPLPAALVQGRVMARLWPLRGAAWMVRGARPVHSGSKGGSTVLPAGYQGEHIRKHADIHISSSSSASRREE
jgi:signal peptidase I